METSMANSNYNAETLELLGVECNMESIEEEIQQNNTYVKQLNGELGILNGSNYHSEPSLTSTCTENDDDAETCVKRKFSFDENSLEILPLEKRPLLTGKEYHFFVSFSSKDEELVKPIVEALETEGLKCMFADRDFTAGRLILENIQEKVQRSMKMLLMMTEHFAESGFCKHEHLVAKHVALLENRHHCIIPIMLRPCEVPEELRMLTYINTEKEIDIIGKIIEAYDVEDRMDCFIPTQLNLVYTTVPIQTFSDVSVDDNQCNGYVLVSSLATSIRKNNLGAGLEFHELKESEKQKLSDADLQDANRVYEEIRMILNSLWLIKIQRLLVPGRLCTSTFCCLIIALSVSFIFLYGIIFISLRRSEYFTLSTLLYDLLATVLICVTLGIIWKLTALKSQKKLLSIIWKQGKKSFLQWKYFIILNQRNPLRLDFIRYDTEPCKDYIEGKLRSFFPRLTQDEVERRAEDELEKCILKNLFSQENPFSKIPKAYQQRHSSPTVSKLCCLCQLILLPDPSTCSVDAGPLTV